MISVTQIRKALKLCVYDPKEKGTEWNIQARDMSPVAHFTRARQLITYYLEGVYDDETVLLHAVWHLACGVAKREAFYATVRQTAGSDTTGTNS